MRSPEPATDRFAEFTACFGVFEAEFAFTHNALRRYGISESDAEDLAQEVFLVMWRRWAHYDRSRPIRPWLSGIAFRVAYNHRQRLGREVPGGLIDRQDETPDPEQHLATHNARKLVRRVLEALEEKHRALIVAHDVDGTTVREIASRMRVPIPTAHTRLRAARRAFARMWKRFLAISGTRARIASLLPATQAASDDLTPPPTTGTRGRRRTSARSRLVLPTALVGARRDGPRCNPRPRAPAALPTTALWKACLPIVTSLLIAGAGLLSAAFAPRAAAEASVVAPATDAVPAIAGSIPVAPGGPGRLAARTLSSPRMGAPLAGADAAARERTRDLATGLVGYWRFDESPGSPTARDLSGHGNDCHLRNLDPAAAFTEGRLGAAVHFNGKGWLECPSVEALAGLDKQITLAAWVRRAGRGQNIRALVTRQLDQGSLDVFHFGFRHDQLALRSRIKGGPIFAGFPVRRGEWHHVAATVDRAGLAQLFIDGQLMKKKRKAGRPSLGGGSNPLIIGGGSNGPDDREVHERFQGQIDELTIYDRALGDDEVRALAQGLQPPLSP